MLTFNEAQAAYLRGQRSAFNMAQRNMHGNAAGLPSEFWRQVDTDIGTVPRQVLSVFNDLAASVSRPVPVGPKEFAYAVANDSGNAHVSLDGVWSGGIDNPEFAHFSTAVPVYQDKFRISWRDFEAARANGWSLDMAARDNSLNAVARGLEDSVLNGNAAIVVNGVAHTGLRTNPGRATRTTAVALNGATGAQWVTEITATLKLLHAANYREPATIYLNWDDWFYAGNTDFSLTQSPGKTILQRVREISGIAAIVPASRVPVSEIIALVKQRQTVQLLSAMPLAVVPQFRANADDPYDFKAIAVAGLQLRQDGNGGMGVAHSAP